MYEQYAERITDAERKSDAWTFEEKYNDFLTELREMPKNTPEEKELRWQTYMAHPQQTDFSADVYKKFRSRAYDRLVRRLQNTEKACEDADAGIASIENKAEVDNVVLYEAVKDTICSYTGINLKGEKYSFLQGVGRHYQQRVQLVTTDGALGNRGISDSTLSKKALCYIAKLVKAAKSYAEMHINDQSGIEALEKGVEEAVNEALNNQTGHIYTKREQELARVLLFGKDKISLDENSNEDEDGVANSDRILGEKELYEEKGYQIVSEKNALDVFLSNLKDEWEIICAAKRLREQKIMRMFFSKDILKELKLDSGGEPYHVEPAGNEDIYGALKPQGDFLYERIFYRNYLDRAFAEYPGKFYEVYCNLLREDFDFSDKILAELEGKNPSTISRWHDEHLKIMKGFKKYYTE